MKAANKLFLDAVGFSREDVTGKNLLELEPNCTGVREQIADLEKYGTCTFRGQLIDKNGKTVFLEQTLVYVENGENDLIASVSCNIGELISEKQQRHQLETELKHAREREKAANNLKSEFIANMNHEIRTPMNAIIGYAEMLSVANLGDREQRFVKTIRKNSATLLSILNDVMELSKLEAGKVKILKSTTNLQLILDEVVDLFTDQLRAKNIDFSCTLQPDMPKYFVLDGNHTRQILTNLVSNALKFTQNGKVSLTVNGALGTAGFFDLSFTVTDTGAGIPEEEQKNILDLFRQPTRATTSSQEGKRFGLTLCTRLAWMMGGGINFTSTPGQGSSFTFTLPAKTEQRLEPGKAVPTQLSQSGQSTDEHPSTLLVVDDVPMISELIKEFFAMSPLEIVSAETAEDGLDLARSLQPNLILMDLNLAGVDGREVTAKLREDSEIANIPVVVMTGRMLTEEEYQPLFDDFLAKPFHLNELQRVVERFIPMNQTSSFNTPAQNEPSQEQDVEQIRKIWNDDLDELLNQAVVSGSLDVALHLGRLLNKRGKELEIIELQHFGEQLKDFAAEPDILGVEQLLGVLQKITGGDK